MQKIPQKGHEGGGVHWVGEYVSLQCWLGVVQPQEEGVTGAQTHLCVKTEHDVAYLMTT